MIVPAARRAATAAGSARSPTAARSRPSRSTILPRSVLARLSGDSVISLSRKCGASPRSMSRVVTSAVGDVGRRSTGCARAVVAVPARCRRACRRERRRGRRPARRARRRGGRSAPSPRRRRRARWRRVAVLGEADVDALPAAVEREHSRPGSSAAAAPMATEPSNDGDRAAERLEQVDAAGWRWRATSAGITLASVVIGPAKRSRARPEVGVVVDVAVEHADDERRRRRRPAARARRCSPGGRWARR